MLLDTQSQTGNMDLTLSEAEISYRKYKSIFRKEIV